MKKTDKLEINSGCLCFTESKRKNLDLCYIIKFTTRMLTQTRQEMHWNLNLMHYNL